MPRPRLAPLPEDNSDSSHRSASRYSPLDTIQAIATPWLLPGRIVQNGLCVLEGDPSVGKSTFLASLTAAITTGRSWLSRPKGVSESVLWLAGEEDPASAVRPRLEAAGADLSRVLVPEICQDGASKSLSLPSDLRQLRDVIDLHNLSLVILDPMVCYLALEVDLHHEQQVRSILDQLNHITMSSHCCIILTRHLKKDRSGPRLTHGLGSVAISATARSVLVIDHPDLATERRVLRVVKCNAAPRTPPVEYRLDFGVGPPVMADVRELGRAEDDPAGDLVDAGDRDVRADARTLLRTLLVVEWVRTKTIISAATDAGIGERTLRKAKADLGVRSRHVTDATPSYFEWGPPVGGYPPLPAVQSATVQSGQKPSKPRKKRAKKK